MSTTTGTNDVINSGSGSDTIDGGAGSDRLNAGSGDDVLVYVVTENLSVAGTRDFYSGGSGVDTVRLVFTRSLWENGGEAEVLRYQAHLAAVTNPVTGQVSNSSASDFEFHFSQGSQSSTLIVSMTEKVEWHVADNSAPALTGDLPQLQAGTEDTPYIIQESELLEGYTDADFDSLAVSNVTSEHGTVVNNGDGTWTVEPADNFSGEVTLDYVVEDGFGGSMAATQSFEVVAVADEPSLTVSDASSEGNAPIALDLTALLADGDGSETLSITIDAVPAGWTLSAGTLIDEEAGTYALTPGDLDGLEITPPSGTAGSIQLTVTATATETSNGDAASTTNTVTVEVSQPNSFHGQVIDGYIAGATVFADADGDRELDQGEVRATTDANGEFLLVGANPLDPLVMFGGTDVSTGLAFEGKLTAPAGSEVVTPLTTLMSALMESAPSLDAEAAQDLVKAAFGLSETIDLTSFDPVQETLDGTTGAAEVLAAGIQVQNAIVQVTALLGEDGAGPTGSNQAAADAAIASLAGLIADAAGPDPEVDLALSETIDDLITDSATAAAVTVSAEVIAAAAEVLSASNQAIDNAVATVGDPTAVLTEIAEVAAVAQGEDLTGAVADAGDQNTASSLADDYELTDIETEADNNTEIGDVDGGLIGTAGADTLTGGAGNDAIDGLTGPDLLTGGAGNDTILGSAGNDTLRGGPGDDVLNGGTLATLLTPESFADQDRVDYSLAAGAVNVNLATNIVASDGDGGHDTLSGIEYVIGSSGDDTITGSSTTFAEFYEGGPGNDTINAGDGNDRAIYSAATGPITVVLGSGSPGSPNSTGTVTGDASVGTDTLSSVEAIRGTDSNDTFTAIGFVSAVMIGGPAGWLPVTYSEFEGMGGNDTIVGVGSRISFQTAPSLDGVTGVTVSFSGAQSGTAIGATTGTDTFSGVSQVRGSMFVDTFNGGTLNTGTQQWEGRGGNDFIDGGSGFDIARYPFDGPITVGLTINMAAGTVTGDPAYTGTDTLRNVESVQASILADVYDATGYGAPGALNVSSSNGTFNEFEGSAGNDTITGNGNTRVSYNQAREAVVVNIQAGTGDGGASVGQDTFTGVNQVRGSGFDDLLIGSNHGIISYETFQGRAGDDTINGGGGLDQTAYQDDTTSTFITVDMAFYSPSEGRVVGDAFIGTDHLVGISSVRGTSFNDIYNAVGFNSGITALAGGLFNEFEGGPGNDTIIGNGVTRITYLNAGGGVSITFTGAGTGFTGGAAGVDNFSGVDRVRASNFDDTITGSNANEQFEGRGGNDAIDGGGGFDEARYDTASGGGSFIFNAAGVITANANASNQGVDALTGIEFVRGTSSADTYNASAYGGFNRFEGVGGDDLITGNGITELSHLNSAAGVTVNIQTGIASGSTIGTDHFSGVNSVVGSNLEDSLIGSDNTVGTNETFTGRGGNDTIDGAGGFDIAQYGFGATGPSAFTVDAAGVVTANAAGQGLDTLSNIEFIVGTNFDDLFDSSFFAGPISFAGNAGNDTIIGGGATQIDYVSASAPVVVDLHAGTASGAGTDTFSGVNFVTGSNFNDTISGASGADSLLGNAGADLVNGREGHDELNGNGGEDTLIGGSGNDLLAGGTEIDRADYSSALGPVTVNLAAGTASDGEGGTDTLVSIEQAMGSAYGDTITGDAQANRFDGEGGNDTIVGGGGPDGFHGGAANDLLIGGDQGDSIEGDDGEDTLVGGGGNDTLMGGNEIDQANYSSAFGPVTVNLAAGTASDGEGGSDILVSIEQVAGSVYGDTIAGDGQANRFDGGEGNDTITGGGNHDAFHGDAGDDRLVGGSGNDYVNGGDGNDWLIGGNGNDTIDGGADVDTLDLSMDAGANHISLLLNFMTNGFDTVYNVENVIGSNDSDVVQGDNGANLLSTGGNSDNIQGEGGNDTISGGAGDDSLSGGAGADTFVWGSGDEGSPATDTVFDFDSTLASGTDALDLSDILDGASAAALDDFLDFSWDGFQTTIDVRSQGLSGSIDQKIILREVNLTSIGTDGDIISALVTNGKLITE